MNAAFWGHCQRAEAERGVLEKAREGTKAKAVEGRSGVGALTRVKRADSDANSIVVPER